MSDFPGHRRARAAVDLVVVGAGIVGLATAVEAMGRGLSVTVIERDECAVGASVRNFGHICTTAQDGEALGYALVSRETWLSLGRKAGFEVVEAGTVTLARTDAEVAVLEEFAALRGPEQVGGLERRSVPFDVPELKTAAHFPLDLRVDPREAIPALSRWLADVGVEFLWETSVTAIDPGVVHTSRGPVAARRVVHAVGHDVDRLFPDLAAEQEVVRCRLRMLEVAPPGEVRIEPAILTGLSMLRYGGLAGTAAARVVHEEIAAAHPELLDVEMNLMLTQRPDGSLVLGDTHHYARTHVPFEDEAEVDLLLREGARLFGRELSVRRRWRGIYAASPGTDFFVAAPHPDVRLVAVTSGIGMTTAFGFATTVLDDLL